MLARDELGEAAVVVVLIRIRGVTGVTIREGVGVTGRPKVS